ncbi:MAG: efflux RND transporter periplasmic adaptor subunit [Gemmatimonadales bacterium]|nr:efflux RND transporter periplasmic adaptor subunit [Gemmatimonadales bacterium]
MRIGFKQTSLGGALLAAVSVVVLSACGGGVEVTTAEVVRDTLSVPITVEGKTRARDMYAVAAPITGRVSRLLVRAGESVTEGQHLATVYPAPGDTRAIASAEAEVQAAEAGLTQAQSLAREAETNASQAAHELERRLPLAEIGALTAETIEHFRSGAEMAEQRLEASQAAVDAAEALLRGSRSRLAGMDPTAGPVTGIEILAPIAGRVLRLIDESERVVQAGSTLLELADTEGLEVVLDVLSEDAVRITPGNPLVITTWGGDGVLNGVIRAATLAGHTKVSSLGVEEQRVDVIADLLDYPATLGTGYRVQGEVVVWTGTDVLTVPTAALFRSTRSWQVFVVVAGQAERREVAIGQRNDQTAQVLGGLDAGDEVILFPSGLVEDGERGRASSE